MKLHKSITEDRVIDAVERTMHDLENVGFCIECGEEADSCEPDAENYKCEVCGARQVFGAEQVLLNIAG